MLKRYRVNEKPFKKALNIIRQILFLKQLKPYAFIPYITLNSKYIGLIWKFTGAKFACWNQRDEGREVYGSRLEKLSANNVPVIVSNSIPGKEAIMYKIGIAEHKIKIINNGIVIPEHVEPSIDWKKELNLPEQSLIVSMLASIYRYKDHMTLIKAWAIVQQSLKNETMQPVLILAGTFKGMENELKVLCYDLRIADSVYFIGATPNTNALIEQSSLVVHSSNKEGVPNVLCEAMALQKAVVATDIPGDREALTNTYQDYTLSEPNNPKDLADKIIYLLEHPQLKEEIGVYNFERVKAHYTTEQMVTVFLDSFKNHTKAIN